MNKKILASLIIIGILGFALGWGTYSYFSDTETSTENTFQAGTLDLKVNDFDDPVGAVVTLDNMCPCQFEEVSVKLTNVGSQDGNVSIHITNVVDSEPTPDTEPEADAEYAPPEYCTPTIDGVLDEGYRLVVTDEEIEVGYLPIKIYVACDEEYMYWFFEATDPTIAEQGIGGTNILWNAEYDGEWLMVYIQDAVYDNEGFWTNTPMPDTELARHHYTVDGVEIYDTLEVKIPRSYAECIGWTYDVWAWGGVDRNTGWGTTSYGDIEPEDFLDCPCKGEEMAQPVELQPGETVNFAIVNEFDIALEPNTYTIITNVVPVK